MANEMADVTADHQMLRDIGITNQSNVSLTVVIYWTTTDCGIACLWKEVMLLSTGQNKVYI